MHIIDGIALTARSSNPVGQCVIAAMLCVSLFLTGADVLQKFTTARLELLYAASPRT